MLQIPLVGPGDAIRGSHDALVTLLEYGDFECPHSGYAYPVVKEVLLRMGDTARFVFRHLPQDGVHPRALLGAQAAEAARAQGKFWQMHDVLFDNQQALEPADLIRHAATLDLDVTRFAAELASGTHLPKVRSDAAGMTERALGTPTFFIDGYCLLGSWNVDVLVGGLAAAARHKRALIETGARPA
jgi:protein-disulfide isomerase